VHHRQQSNGLKVVRDVTVKVETYGQTHQFIAIGAVAGISLVVCGCTVFACGRGGSARQRKARLLESDDEEFDTNSDLNYNPVHAE